MRSCTVWHVVKSLSWMRISILKLLYGHEILSPAEVDSLGAKRSSMPTERGWPVGRSASLTGYAGAGQGSPLYTVPDVDDTCTCAVPDPASPTQVGDRGTSAGVRLDRERTRALLNELRQSEWHSGRWVVPLDHLWLMQRGPNDPALRYIYRVNLQGTSWLEEDMQMAEP